MARFRTYAQVASEKADDDILAQVTEQSERVAARLSQIGRIVIVASGKGGVGKSAISANLAALLASAGMRVGALDADLNGPSLARMLGTPRTALRVVDGAVEPARGAAGVRLVSSDLLLDEGAPLRWRDGAEALRDPDTGRPRFQAPAFPVQSTLEAAMMRELVADVAWGALDYLVIDAPPGTDRLLRMLQLLPRADIVLLVTTPAEIARSVVGRSIATARQAGARHLALVGNMTAHVCERCGFDAPLFEADGARRLAEEANVELWAEVPFDPRVAVSTDSGRPFALERPDTPAALALAGLAAHVAELA